MPDSSIKVNFLRDIGYVNLRGDPNDAGFRKAAESALGQDLPVAANTISEGEHQVYWLGPNEWLVTTAEENIAGVPQHLEDGLVGHTAAVNDLSGGYVAMRLTGSSVRDLFAKGCTLDFHPDVFKCGTCAQSGLAKASVLVGYVSEPDTFDVIVRRSFSDYLSRWLQRAGSEYGIEFR